MSTYPLDIITGALIKTGALAIGEAPSSAEAQFGLSELNKMLDLWQTRRLMVYAVQFVRYTLVPNLSPHTIGPAGSPTPTYIVSQRPVKIIDANVILNNSSPNVKSPLTPRDSDWWNGQSVPSLTSRLPTDLYYNPSWPAGELWFWPVPTIAYGVELETWVLLQKFSALAGAANAFNMPVGYLDAVEWSLAERLCPSLGHPLTAEIVAFASNARKSIQQLNNQPRRIGTRDYGVPTAGRPRPYWNWLTNNPR